METFEPSETYVLQKALETPSHISCLAFGHAGHLFAGSDDGSLRVYDLSSFKVVKAIRGLGSEVSSVVPVKRPGSEFRDAWLGCGKRAMKFQLESPKMIQTVDDALFSIELGETEEDILNELALNSNKTHLAFTMDSGVVGVLDLSTNVASRMKTLHESICGSVKFVPDRPRELVSGGYDTALLHFDFMQGNILSKRKMPPYTVVDGMSLSPPFIMSTAMSSEGVLAAGTADGRLYIGFGGRKGSVHGSKKKRARKWEGLDEEEELVTKIAEGPIVAMTFSEPTILIITTMLGVVTRYRLVFDNEGSLGLDKTWEKTAEKVKKVNALVADENRIIVGGLTADGKGVFEIWKRNELVDQVH